MLPGSSTARDYKSSSSIPCSRMQCFSPIAEAAMILSNPPSDLSRRYSHSQLKPAPLRLRRQPRNHDNETGQCQVMDTLEESLDRNVAAPLVGPADTDHRGKRVRPVEPSSSTNLSCASDIAIIISKFEVLQATSATMSRSPVSTQPPSSGQAAFFSAESSSNPRQAIQMSVKDAAQNGINTWGLGVPGHPAGERARKDNHGYQASEAVSPEDLTIGMQQCGSLPATSTKRKQNVTRTEHSGLVETMDRSSAWDSKPFAERRMIFEQYRGRYFRDVLVFTRNPLSYFLTTTAPTSVSKPVAPNLRTREYSLGTSKSQNFTSMAQGGSGESVVKLATAPMTPSNQASQLVGRAFINTETEKDVAYMHRHSVTDLRRRFEDILSRSCTSNGQSSPKTSSRFPLKGTHPSTKHGTYHPMKLSSQTDGPGAGAAIAEMLQKELSLGRHYITRRAGNSENSEPEPENSEPAHVRPRFATPTIPSPYIGAHTPSHKKSSVLYSSPVHPLLLSHRHSATRGPQESGRSKTAPSLNRLNHGTSTAERPGKAIADMPTWMRERKSAADLREVFRQEVSPGSGCQFPRRYTAPDLVEMSDPAVATSSKQTLPLPTLFQRVSLADGSYEIAVAEKHQDADARDAYNAVPGQTDPIVDSPVRNLVGILESLNQSASSLVSVPSSVGRRYEAGRGSRISHTTSMDALTEGGEVTELHTYSRGTRSNIWRKVSTVLDKRTRDVLGHGNERLKSGKWNSHDKAKGLHHPGFFSSLSKPYSSRDVKASTLLKTHESTGSSPTSPSIANLRVREREKDVKGTAPAPASNFPSQILVQADFTEAPFERRASFQREFALRESYAGLGRRGGQPVCAQGAQSSSPPLTLPYRDAHLSAAQFEAPSAGAKREVLQGRSPSKPRSRYPSSWGRKTGKHVKKGLASPVLTTEKGQGSAVFSERQAKASWGRKAAAAAFGIRQRLREWERDGDRSGSSSAGTAPSSWAPRQGATQLPIVATMQCDLQCPRPAQLVNFEKFSTYCQEKPGNVGAFGSAIPRL